MTLLAVSILAHRRLSSTPKTCEGACEVHSENLRQVHVVDNESGRDWGEFTYCDNAIQEDLRRGFQITGDVEALMRPEEK
jgi:hypothetical protein